MRTLGIVLVLALAGACGPDEKAGDDAVGAASGNAGDRGGGAGVSAAGRGRGASGQGGRATNGGAAGSGAAGKASGGASAGGAGGPAGAGGAGSGGRAGSESAAGKAGDAGSNAAGGTGGKGGSAGAAASGGGEPCETSGIVVDGRELLLDCQPFQIRGVCWNPVRRGEGHPAGLDYPGFVEEDATLMQAIGINVVRTYEPLTNREVLDALYEKGIRVLNGVYVYGGDPASVVSGRVSAVADHPAILGWVLGNEWNYNGLYVSLSHADSLARLNEAANLIRAEDTSHPIVTVYGEVPTTETIDAMPDVDIWGINAYRGISFGDLFDVWASRSEKPMFLAEYGADAYDATEDEYDPESQAMAVRALTLEILEHSSAEPDGVAIGGTLFEWNDEWWKDQEGSLDVQDEGGIAPGGGPYPDSTFNEEWWGIVDIERTPRAAYEALGDVYGM